MRAEQPSFSSGFENSQITPLTGLRGIAASLVVAYHFHANEPSAIQPFLRKAGFLGIATFFALSGYILAYLYFVQFTSNLSSKTYYNFLVKRIARIYPLHLMMLILMLLLYPRFINPANSNIQQLLGNLTLTHAWGLAPFSFVEASWTISIEMLFYLMLPLLILILNPQRAFVSLLVLVPLYVCINARVIPIAPLCEPYADHRIFTYGSFFIFGVGIWFSTQIKSCILKATDNSIMFVVCCILIVWSTYQDSDLWVYLVSALCIPVIIRSAHISKAGSVLLGFPPFVWLGLISYSIYMLHQFIQRLVRQVCHGTPSDPVYEWASVYCLILVCSVLCYYLVELPTRAMIRKRAVMP